MNIKTTSGVRTVMFACLAGLSSMAGAETAHDAHAHAAHSQHEAMTLSLDQGRQWETDAPLRAGMESLRMAFAERLHAIHADELSAEGYVSLGEATAREVGTIVAQCRLRPEADAMLHLIVAELMSAADLMMGKAEGAPREGAHKAVMALDDYGRYFDHPGWMNLE